MMAVREFAVGWASAALALSACAGVGAPAAGGQGPAASAPAAAITTAPTDAPVTLDGAAILQRTCTECHSLRGLSAYANYWGEPEWLSMVETMIGYGAKLSDDEVPVLVRYLAENYGTARKAGASAPDLPR